MNQKELIDIWNSVWVEGMTEIEIQKKYFKKLQNLSGKQEKFYISSSFGHLNIVLKDQKKKEIK